MQIAFMDRDTLIAPMPGPFEHLSVMNAITAKRRLVNSTMSLRLLVLEPLRFGHYRPVLP